MAEEILNFSVPSSSSNIIKVLGVGGGGCNAVSHMYEEGIRGVDYILCNTDAQAMQNSPVPVKVQLGVTLTEGRGAGNRPEMGEEAAKENYDDIKELLQENTKMLFITAGMGGGTGTGATPVIASLAKELEILTIAVVTIPSPAEGKKRFGQALEGIEKLKNHVDSMLVISNQRLHNIYGDLPARQAFKKADDIVASAVKGVAEIITIHGNINIDFTDVYTVMEESNVFIMGTGFAKGESRAIRAVHKALESPLLDSNDIYGTKNILLNIISGSEEIRIGEIGEIIELLQDKAGQEADIIWGNGYDESLGDEVSVTILATGFINNPNNEIKHENPPQKFNLKEKKAQSIIEEEPESVFEEEKQPVFELETQSVFEEEKQTVLEEEQQLVIDEEPDLEVTHEETIHFTHEEPPVLQMAETPVVEKKKVIKKKTINTSSKQDPTLDNWFSRQFGKFFDDKDDSLEDGN